MQAPTEIVLPRYIYPHGYRVRVRGAKVASEKGAPLLDLLAEHQRANRQRIGPQTVNRQRIRGSTGKAGARDLQLTGEDVARAVGVCRAGAVGEDDRERRDPTRRADHRVAACSRAPAALSDWRSWRHVTAGSGRGCGVDGLCEALQPVRDSRARAAAA